jgi:hypothetical protein
MLENWQKIIVLVLIICIIVAIIYLIYRLDERKDKIIAALSVLVPSLILLIGTLLSKAPVPVDYELHNRPWLEPTLIISNMDSDSFRVSYEIKNAGKLPAEKMRLFFVSPQVIKVDKSIRHPRSIAPDGKLIYEPIPLPFKIKQLLPSSWFILYIDYHSLIDKKDHPYRSEFGVLLRKDEFPEGRYIPSAVRHIDGEFSDQELEQLLGIRMNFSR